MAKAVADRHGISTGLLFTWRKEMLAAAMSGFVPVGVAPETPKLEPPPAGTGPMAEAAGTIELVLPSGATVRIIGQVDAARRAVRQARSRPLLADLHDWIETQRRRLSGKSGLAKALQYALGRWDALTRHLGDGRPSVDNNLSGRLLRGIAVTRKSFLLLGSGAGGERAAIIYTVAETAKLNGLDPEAYIATVLDRLARGHTIARLGELLPWTIRLEGAR